MSDQIERLEERVAHLIRVTEELSDELARQGREIDRLTRLTELLREREAQRGSGDGGIFLGDERPPHY